MGGGARWAAIYGVTQSRTQLKRLSSSSSMGSFLVAGLVKNLPAMQETPVHSLGQEDPLEKGMATHSSILPGESHGQGSLVGCRLWGHTESDTTEAT